MRIYFDNAATTPLFPEVIDDMTEVMREYFGNPSSIHFYGRHAKSIIEEARKTLANCLNASIGEIFFTSGGTESNNTAIKCSVRDLGIRRIITSPVEHPSVLQSIKHLDRKDVECIMLPIDQLGRPDLDILKQHLSAGTRPTLVSLMHANNELGTMTDIAQVAEHCTAYGALFHSDTVQTVAHFPIDLSATSVSFISGSAHKFHGPKGIGFLYVKGSNAIEPLIDGGSQERNMRAGTENTVYVRGLAKAFQICCDRMEEMSKYVTNLKIYLKTRLEQEFADVRFNGDPEGSSLYTVLSTSFPAGPRSDLLLMNLDIEGVAASGGSACSSGAIKGSHVLQAISPDDDRVTIRFSLSDMNSRDEIDYLIDKIKKILD
ncbi:MAG: cysteine desulfurase [Saprospiraceae bacterium]|nr:cysteine desulfurase [Saprospiraceae bacterium]